MPTDPPIPPTLDPQAAAQLEAFYNKLKEETAAIIDMWKGLNELFGKSPDKIKTLQEALSGAKAKMLDAGNAINGVRDAHADLVQKITDATTGYIGLTSTIAGTTTAFSSFTKDTSVATGELSKAVGAISAIIPKFDTITASVPGLASVTSALGKLGKGMMDAFEHTATLEQGFVQMMASSGDLNKILSAEGTGIGNLDQYMTDYIDRTYEVAKATGIGSDKIAEFMKSMQIVQGFNEGTAMVGTTTGEKGIQAIQAATQVAMTTSGGLKTVQEELLRGYEKFDQGADKAKDVLNYVSNLNEVSSRLHINFDQARMSVESTADQFALLGNNSMSALRVLNDFVPAFTATGASAKQATDLVKGMSEGISHMDTASKAFMSGRSGGPGGLQGAFRIDSLMAQGKYDEVIKMAENNLKRQFGGNTVTLSEAGQSQTAAAQYQRQLSFIKNSGFGNLAKDDQSAAKFFDAMKNGPISGSAAKGMLMGGDSALTASMNTGRQFQDRNNTRVQQISEDVRKIATFAERDRARNVRNLIGTGDDGGVAQSVRQENMFATDRAIGGTNYGTDPKNVSNIAFMNMLESGMRTAGKIRDVNAILAPEIHPNASSASPMSTEQRDVMMSTAAQQTGTIMGAATVPSGIGNQALIRRQNSIQPQSAISIPSIRGNNIGISAAEKQMTQGSKQFPNELILTGQLETKCPDCGTKSDARIIAKTINAIQGQHNVTKRY